MSPPGGAEGPPASPPPATTLLRIPRMLPNPQAAGSPCPPRGSPALPRTLGADGVCVCVCVCVWLWGRGLRALRLLPSRDRELPDPSPREAKVRARPGPRAGRGGELGPAVCTASPRTSPGVSPVPRPSAARAAGNAPETRSRGPRGALCLPGSSGSRGALDAARAPTSRGGSLTCGPRLSSPRNSARRPGARTNG